MANPTNMPRNVQLPTAVKSQQNFDLSCTHITTGDWMQFQPVYARELIPGQSISVDASVFARLNPMPLPTLGGGQLNYKAFFVPFRTIYEDWNKFITDSPKFNKDLTNFENLEIPLLSLKTLGLWFNVHGATAITPEPGARPPEQYDFFMKLDDGNPGGQPSYGTLNYIGRYAMKVIRTLGYQPVWSNLPGVTDTFASALPLLSLCKIYLDWFSNTQYYEYYAPFQRVNHLLQNNNRYRLSIDDLDNIFNLLLFVNYDFDYFTGAWDNPNAASNNTSFLPIVIPDINYLNTQPAPGVSPAEVNSDDPSRAASVEWTIKSDTRTLKLNEYLLTSLHALSDFAKRQQLAGAMPIDRYLAMFGQTLSAEKMIRSNYLGNVSKSLQFGAILANASTNDAVLGEFAGQGVAVADNVNFSFETQEFGYFIIVQTITPKIGYVQGVDRSIYHTQLTDFFIPEFDALGTQAIAKSELYVPYDNPAFAGNTYYKGIFGFTPRYAEYKTSRDMFTGDMSLLSKTGQDAWHTFRMFKKESFRAPSEVVHSYNFGRGLDALQFNRLFYNDIWSTIETGTNIALDQEQALLFLNRQYDNFNIIINFNVNSQLPAKSLYNTYEFHDVGKTVTMNVAGSKLN